MDLGAVALGVVLGALGVLLGLVLGALAGYSVGYKTGVRHTIIACLSILPKDQARDFAKVFKHHLDKHKREKRVGS